MYLYFLFPTTWNERERTIEFWRMLIFFIVWQASLKNVKFFWNASIYFSFDQTATFSLETLCHFASDIQEMGGSEKKEEEQEGEEEAGSINSKRMDDERK